MRKKSLVLIFATKFRITFKECSIIYYMLSYFKRLVITIDQLFGFQTPCQIYPSHSYFE